MGTKQQSISMAKNDNNQNSQRKRVRVFDKRWAVSVFGLICTTTDKSTLSNMAVYTPFLSQGPTYSNRLTMFICDELKPGSHFPWQASTVYVNLSHYVCSLILVRFDQILWVIDIQLQRRFGHSLNFRSIRLSQVKKLWPCPRICR